MTFDTIRVFERREDSGGCWLEKISLIILNDADNYRLEDAPNHKQELPDIQALTSRTADKPLPLPSSVPSITPASTQYRFSDTSIYPDLTTNINVKCMSFSQEPMSEVLSDWTRKYHGDDSPFRHWKVVKDYISNLLDRHNYNSLVSYNTTVELVSRNLPDSPQKWTLTLRKAISATEDKWWTEMFDAVVVANGHYTVPYLPPIPGLDAYAKKFPSKVTHSKSFRSPKDYINKSVIVIGASISGPDIASALAHSSLCKGQITSVVRGKYHPYFFDYAFQHPRITRKYGISHFDADSETVHFADGTSQEKPDAVIFGTGYTWTLPFLCTNDGRKLGNVDIQVRNNRVPGLYQHIFHMPDPTLCFVGAVAAGFTFKVYEWQAVLCARFLAGRISLPPIAEMQKWEEDRIAYKGDGVPFTALYPDFEEYFEEVRKIAGDPVEIDGKVVGRKLPVWEKKWREEFDAAHLRRIEYWKRINREAEARIEEEEGGGIVKSMEGVSVGA